MAITGIYNNDREMVLSRSQAQAFNQTIQYFRTNGVGGDSVFEDTYVLQKQVAEYIKENVGENELIGPTIVNEIYSGVLGLTPPPTGDASPDNDDMEADEYSSPTPPTSNEPPASRRTSNQPPASRRTSNQPASVSRQGDVFTQDPSLG